MSSLSIWCNQQFHTRQATLFESAIAPHRLVFARSISASNLVAAPSDDLLINECDIAFGQPSPDDVSKAKRLKAIFLSSAGYSRYDTPAFRELCRDKGVMVCNASGVYDEPCAQHALAMMLATTRRLPQAFASQLQSKSWPYLELRSKSELLGPGSKVLLVGYGSIARRLAELLMPFGVDLTGFRRQVRGNEAVKTLPIAEIDAHLPVADHIVNILPASESTQHFFNAERFARMKAGAHYYNLGRGDTNDQAALIDALNCARLSSAYLDVTSPEPLPAEHPLWKAPNCYITPHTAGGTTDEAERQISHFADNLRRFATNQPLRDRIF